MAVRPTYFAGLQLKSRIGISSEDVIIYKILESETRIIDKLGVFFLPTLSDQDFLNEEGKTRILIHYFSSWSDYVIITRPFSFPVEYVEDLARKLRGKGDDNRVIASFAAPRLSSLRKLASRFSEIVDGFEIDLGLTYLLTGSRRNFESYAIDMIEEFISESRRPVLVKISPNTPLSQEFIQQLKAIGVSGVVFTPHLTYTIGKEFFRIHATYLSKIYALVWAKLIAGTDVTTAYISDVPEQFLDELAIERTFDIQLFDTALLSNMIELPPISEARRDLPVKWPMIPYPLKPAINISREAYCIKVCPFRAFEKDELPSSLDTNLLSASKRCDYCGLCLSCCKTLKLVATITPE